MISAILTLSSPLEQLLRERPFAAVPLLFAAGVATSLTPCIYPMIPITAGVLGGAGAVGRSRRKTALLTFTYVMGLALVYATLGLLAGLSGSLFGAISANRWAYFTIGNLLLVFALAMLDVIPVTVPGKLMSWAGRIGGGSMGGAFLMGATSGLVAAPCGAPAFAAVLTFVAATRSGMLGFVYLFVFSLGMTAILVAVGLSSGMLAALPKSGRWLLLVKRAAGVILLLMAEYYFVQMGKVS
ncbi:MAG: cytochrome c biogenesis protein CcdA [Gemmatimonadota bacterium]